MNRIPIKRCALRSDVQLDLATTMPTSNRPRCTPCTRGVVRIRRGTTASPEGGTHSMSRTHGQAARHRRETRHVGIISTNHNHEKKRETMSKIVVLNDIHIGDNAPTGWYQ